MGSRVLKISIFASLLIYLCNVSYSSYCNFDFSLKEYLVSENKETEVSFSFLLSGYKNTDFLVKPYIVSGTVEIFNSDKNMWVTNFSNNDLLPLLSENIAIRFRNFEVAKTYLWFEIKNLRNGEVYFTPKKNIWNNKVYGGYVEEINYSVSNYENGSEEKSKEVFEVSQTSVSYQNPYLRFVENIPSKFYLYISGIVFSASAVSGLLSGRSKRKREMIQSISEDFKKLPSRNYNDGSYLRAFLDSRSSNKQNGVWKSTS